jgi:protein-tyrosine phosphatase
MNRGCVAALDATPRAHVLVHCRGRLGRAIIVAASLLIELGMEPTKAFEHVRAVRLGAIETGDQERYVRSICTAQK